MPPRLIVELGLYRNLPAAGRESQPIEADMTSSSELVPPLVDLEQDGFHIKWGETALGKPSFKPRFAYIMPTTWWLCECDWRSHRLAGWT